LSSDFYKDVSVELGSIRDALGRAMTNTLVDGLSFVTARAAVDTGRYRAAWNISKNTPDDSVPKFIKKQKGHKKGSDIYGLKKKARILFDVTKDRSIILSNNVEYAPHVDALYGDRIITKTRMKAALRRRLKAIK
jgi:hypothetical protein